MDYRSHISTSVFANSPSKRILLIFYDRYENRTVRFNFLRSGYCQFINFLHV